MIDTIEQTICQHCGRPIVQSSRRGPRPRQYCNDVCWQLAYRKRKEEQAREAIKQCWAGCLPSTKQMLEDLMQRYGEELAQRVATAILDEQDRMKKVSHHHVNLVRAFIAREKVSHHYDHE